MNKREKATVLAALCLWRETANKFDEEWMKNIATDDGNVEALNDDEIDALCERINCDDGD
jgi:hypothetical protein